MTISRGSAPELNGTVDPSVARLFDPLDPNIAAELAAMGARKRASRSVNGVAPAPALVDLFRSTVIPESGWDLRRYVELLGRDIVPHSVATSSPRCLAHMTPTVPAAMAPLASLIVSLNQNLIRTDASTTLMLCERQALGMLHRLVFQRSARFYERNTHHPSRNLGAFVSGGTLANVTAIWCARNAALSAGNVRRLGLADALARTGHRGAALVGPESMHYSFAKAADLTGIGEANLVRVRVDENDRVDPRALLRAVRRCQQDGRLVVAVVGVAGSTNAGAVDALSDVADVAEEAGCHFHVDAAWGGPALLSSRQRDRLNGIARADTVTLDGHKQFHLPVGAGFLLFRSPVLARHLEHVATYTVRKGSGDPGLRSPEGSRAGTALLLHAALHLFGCSGYGELVDVSGRQAAYFAAQVRRRPRFQLLRDPQLNIVLYRYVPATGSSWSDPRDVDALNVGVHRLQRRAGRALVSRTTTSTKGPHRVVALRAVLANPMTTAVDIDAVLSEQERLGRLLERRVVEVPEEND
jgi:putative pyridoxal-dependent aspartate 1-decarboxylase